ncbi:MAG: hypothetical protein ACRC67_16530 [Inquilinus sp.]|uniref:hypothetical protein n=1 Tax=Inquilinus sp. TaxID=1932117 RepID=UPI003F311231
MAASPDEDPETLRVETTSGETLATYPVKEVVKEFPMRELATRTPWTEESDPIRYRGPDLKEVLTKAGLGDTPQVRVFAYDHFEAVLKMAEIDQYRPILAVERACSSKDKANGACSADQAYKRLSLDDTGPFAIIWPMDDMPDSYTIGRNFIWVWFVTVIRPEL